MEGKTAIIEEPVAVIGWTSDVKDACAEIVKGFEEWRAAIPRMCFHIAGLGSMFCGRNAYSADDIIRHQIRYFTDKGELLDSEMVIERLEKEARGEHLNRRYYIITGVKNGLPDSSYEHYGDLAGVISIGDYVEKYGSKIAATVIAPHLIGCIILGNQHCNDDICVMHGPLEIEQQPLSFWRTHWRICNCELTREHQPAFCEKCATSLMGAYPPNGESGIITYDPYWLRGIPEPITSRSSHLL